MTRILNIYSGTEAIWQEHLESLSHPPKRGGCRLAGYQKRLWPVRTPEQRLGSLWESTSWQGPKPRHEALQEFIGRVGWTSSTQEHFPKLSWSSLLAAVSVCVCPLPFLCKLREGAESHGGMAEETQTHTRARAHVREIQFPGLFLCGPAVTVEL